MSIYAMADNNIDIKCYQDAVMYNMFAGNQDLVVAGFGNELSGTAANLVVSIGSGIGIIQGRHITIEGTEELQLEANSSGFIVIRYDLTQSAGNEASVQAVPSIIQNDINDNGTIRDLPLYRYTTDTLSTNLIDVRNLITNSSGSYYEATLLSANWVSGDSGYEQTISVNGMTAASSPVVALVLTPEDYENVSSLQSGFGNIYAATTKEVAITFYASNQPSVNIVVGIKGY